MSESGVQQEDIVRALACVNAHPHAAALGAFAYDVLGTQAEGRALFAGQKFMAQRAQAHAVDAEKASTDLGNLLSILERGPSEPAELALVSAFAARGACAALIAADGGHDERERRARTLVNELDWLETATRYRVWTCLNQLLEPAARSLVQAALALAVAHEDRSDVDGLPESASVRARSAARLSMLGQSGEPGSRSALERTRAEARDPAIRALAAALLGEVLPPPAAPVRVFGRVAVVTRRPLVAELRWVTGYALLHAAWRTLGFLVRLERVLELELDGQALRAHRRTALFGRTVRKTEAVFPIARVRGARRFGRYALVRTVIGSLSLSFGVLLGGYFGFDAARGGASALLSAAAVLCALGTGFDLALDLLGSSVRGDVRLQIDLDGTRAFSLAGVPSAQADAFLDLLGKRLSAGAV